MNDINNITYYRYSKNTAEVIKYFKFIFQISDNELIYFQEFIDTIY